MKDNQRDALTHLGMAMTAFGLVKTNLVMGWSYKILFFGMILFLILSLWEFFFPKTTR
jgi:ABC-type transport system involved in cytochrome bd biosynthesis fused ATPase/permease subunit